MQILSGECIFKFEFLTNCFWVRNWNEDTAKITRRETQKRKEVV